MVFTSVIEQLPSELKMALKSFGLDDPGLLLMYPRYTIVDLHAQGLGIGFSSSIPPSFPPSSQRVE